MRLEGIHHVTAITGDAPANVDFYAGVLGLRLVKKTVNQDDPTVYHLFYADERGTSGSDLTFFEYPGAPRGRAGDGMVHRVLWRVGSAESLDFWARAAAGVGADRRRPALRRPRGAAARAARRRRPRRAAAADRPEIPREHALLGFHGVRAYRGDVGHRCSTRALGFDRELGRARRAAAAASTSTTRRRTSAGCRAQAPSITWPGDRAGRARGVARAGPRRPARSPTPVIDRFYFRRSTSASRAASCSRSRRSARASRPTSRSSPSASGSRCRRRSRSSASRSSRR